MHIESSYPWNNDSTLAPNRCIGRSVSITTNNLDILKFKCYWCSRWFVFLGVFFCCFCGVFGVPSLAWFGPRVNPWGFYFGASYDSSFDVSCTFLFFYVYILPLKKLDILSLVDEIRAHVYFIEVETIRENWEAQERAYYSNSLRYDAY